MDFDEPDARDDFDLDAALDDFERVGAESATVMNNGSKMARMRRNLFVNIFRFFFLWSEKVEMPN